MSKLIWGLVVFLAVEALGGWDAVGAAARQAAGAVPLGQRIQSVLPSREEDLWLQIPWRADFTKARAEAEKAGKPLYMWVMDGNPLGCG